MKSITRYKAFGIMDVILFIITNGLLVYLSSTSHWVFFAVVCGVSSILFLILKVVEFQPVKEYFKKLESKEFYLSSRTNPYGIDEIYNLSNSDEEIEKINQMKQLLKNNSKVKYLGLTGYALVNKDVKILYDDLIAFLDSGKEICILILSPFSEEKTLRNKIHGNNTDYDFSHLVDIESKYGEQVKIKITNFSPYCGLFFSDKELLYDPYHLGKDSKSIKNRLFAMKVLKSQGPYYDILNNHYENIWKHDSCSLNAFLNMHQAIK